MEPFRQIGHIKIIITENLVDACSPSPLFSVVGVSCQPVHNRINTTPGANRCQSYMNSYCTVFVCEWTFGKLMCICYCSWVRIHLFDKKQHALWWLLCFVTLRQYARSHFPALKHTKRLSEASVNKMSEFWPLLLLNEWLLSLSLK